VARIVCGRCEQRHVIETLGAAVFWSALRDDGFVDRPSSRALLAGQAMPSTSWRPRRPIGVLAPAREVSSVFDQLSSYQREV
jgi:hypothetical protein